MTSLPTSSNAAVADIEEVAEIKNVEEILEVADIENVEEILEGSALPETAAEGNLPPNGPLLTWPVGQVKEIPFVWALNELNPHHNNAAIKTPLALTFSGPHPPSF